MTDQAPTIDALLASLDEDEEERTRLKTETEKQIALFRLAVEQLQDESINEFFEDRRGPSD